MKVNDLILQYPTSLATRRDGICRLRTFVNKDNKIIALLTELSKKNTSTSITNLIEHICLYIIRKGFVSSDSIFIEHYEADKSHGETFDLIKIDEKGAPEWIPLTRGQVLELSSCEPTEFDISTDQNSNLVAEIEQLRNKIDPHIDFPYQEEPDKIRRKLEIEKKQITKKSIQYLIESGAKESFLQEHLKTDLSVFAEIYAKPDDEYICFSEFPINQGLVDFVLLTGISRMDVILIEVKGADFFLVNAGSYNKLSSKVETALDQTRNRVRYIYENYNDFRKQIHKIRESVETGAKLHNSLMGPSKNLEVDPGKDINIQAVVIAGRTRDDYEESRKRHDYEQSSIRIMIESWDSWLRKLRRN